VRLVVVGALGRMGGAAIRAVQITEGVELVGALVRKGSPYVGCDASSAAQCDTSSGLLLSDEPEPLFSQADAVIDFTSPTSSADFAQLSAKAAIVHVIGTTAITGVEAEIIAEASQHIPIVKSNNMSLGANLVAALVRQTAAILDDSFDVEILEMHHRNKKDAPSGTALALGQAVARGRGASSINRTVHGEETPGPRKRGDVGFATMRGGTVIGEHHVLFAGEAEVIEIAHKVSDRMVFALGAVIAAKWAFGKPAGLYSMGDVLGIL